MKYARDSIRECEPWKRFNNVYLQNHKNWKMDQACKDKRRWRIPRANCRICRYQVLCAGFMKESFAGPAHIWIIFWVKYASYFSSWINKSKGKLSGFVEGFGITLSCISHQASFETFLVDEITLFWVKKNKGFRSNQCIALKLQVQHSCGVFNTRLQHRSIWPNVGVQAAHISIENCGYSSLSLIVTRCRYFAKSLPGISTNCQKQGVGDVIQPSGKLN